MLQLFKQFLRDEHGFVVSSELVLISTIGVVGLVAGLSEVSYAVNQELEDVGSAFGSLNQSYHYRAADGSKGWACGSRFNDRRDGSDGECDLSCDTPGKPESSW